MKNTFFKICMVLVLSTPAYAQKKKKSVTKQVNVPENVNTSFQTQFAGSAKNQWNKNYSGNYIVDFINADSLKQTAEFDRSGAMIKTRINYSPDILPQQVTDAMAVNYADAKVISCAKIQLPGIPSYYSVKVATPANTQKEILISEEGTVTE